jgi:hypothetical protein
MVVLELIHITQLILVLGYLQLGLALMAKLVVVEVAEFIVELLVLVSMAAVEVELQELQLQELLTQVVEAVAVILAERAAQV